MSGAGKLSICGRTRRLTLLPLSINGVGISTTSHKKSLVRIKDLFKRDVIGINNRSLGLIGDYLESLVGRTLRWPTDSFRDGYEVVKKAVLDDKYRRIVVVAHSQGAILAR